jgi:putative tryptophan/tyrosine transport system substrate-binding protein
MRRREFIALLGGAATWPRVARAQLPTIPLIGFLGAGTLPDADLAAFKGSLRDHNLSEGQNISVEYRWAAGIFARLPALAAELVNLKVGLIVAHATPATLAAKQATKTIPIVMVGVSDPVTTGIIDSLARPGGNVTGVVNLAADLSGKLLELMLEFNPGIKCVAVLWNQDNPAAEFISRENESAARTLGLQLQIYSVRAAEDVERAFASMIRENAMGVVTLPDPIFIILRQSIADLAMRSRIPTIFARRENVEVGGLISYGPSLRDQLYQAANYVDKILKGAKPANLPVEQPTKFELAINLKTAKALGLMVPPSLLVRADEVIE